MANGAVRCGSCLAVFQADLYMEQPEIEESEIEEPVLEEPVEEEDHGEFHSDQSQAGEETPGDVGDQSITIENEDGLSEQEDARENEQEHQDTSDQAPEEDQQLPDDVIYLGYENPEETDELADVVASYWDSFDLYADFLRSSEPPVDPPVETLETAPQYVEVEDVYVEDPDIIVGDLEPTTRVSLGWAACAMLLMVVGLAQYFYFNFERYVADARYRGYTMDLCNYLGCSLPDFSDAASLTTGELSIRTHPDVSEALLVDAIVRNSAVFRQRFPGVKLQFFDLRGQQIAVRTFSAEEYLAGELRGLHYIPANTEVRFALEIVDPGDVAVGYNISVVVR
tara:strand:+ start:1296 stop:2312 length:1017 start_codon:yes stop_codon:yes gene_type:complete